MKVVFGEGCEFVSVYIKGEKFPKITHMKNVYLERESSDDDKITSEDINKLYEDIKNIIFEKILTSEESKKYIDTWVLPKKVWGIMSHILLNNDFFVINSDGERVFRSCEDILFFKIEDELMKIGYNVEFEPYYKYSIKKEDGISSRICNLFPNCISNRVYIDNDKYVQKNISFIELTVSKMENEKKCYDMLDFLKIIFKNEGIKNIIVSYSSTELVITFSFLDDLFIDHMEEHAKKRIERIEL